MPFLVAYTNWLFQQAKQAGLDAICLTEHFNTLGFNELYSYIKKIMKKMGYFFIKWLKAVCWYENRCKRRRAYFKYW